MKMDISFSGQKKVNAHYEGFTICTDQPSDEGGENSAPSPFDYFVSSIGTCAGVYVLSFCERRQISTENIRLQVSAEFHDTTSRLETVHLKLKLPPSFPAKYEKVLLRTMGQCSVKKAILDPPEFLMTSEIGDVEG